MCCALPTLVLQQLEATRLALRKMKTTDVKKFRVTIILFQEPYEKARRRKKDHSATLLFHSELEHVQKLSGSPGPRLPPRKTLVLP